MSRSTAGLALIAGAAAGVVIWWGQAPSDGPANATAPITTERLAASGRGDFRRVPPHEPRPEAARRDVAEARRPAAAPEIGQPQPYRFMGTSTTGTQTTVVLFGKGRVITLTGPGRLDDEHAVEHVADDYLVIRHLPSGRGQFLAFTAQAAAFTR